MRLAVCKLHISALFTFIVGIMIKHGDYHVSLDNVTNKLFLSKTDPHFTLYKHSDGTLRNKKGNKCVEGQ